MKKLLVSFIVVTALSLSTFSAHAQRWLSDKGFWVVESNVKMPREYIIYFYNNEKQLMYKEHLKGVTLSVNRRKTRKRLERVLEQSVTAWEKDHVVGEDRQWVVKGH